MCSISTINYSTLDTRFRASAQQKRKTLNPRTETPRICMHLILLGSLHICPDSGLPALGYGCMCPNIIVGNLLVVLLPYCWPLHLHSHICLSSLLPLPDPVLLHSVMNLATRVLRLVLLLAHLRLGCIRLRTPA
ncbi:hypothetical protein Tco_0718872 [Tanacetum coccineum]